MSKYAEIIERLEKAQGPNYALEREIFKVLADGSINFPPYSCSLEAAMSLVRTHLPGEWIDIGGMTDSTEWECNIHTDYIEVQEHGLTPPLAVLKALFRTLEAKENAG